MTANPVVHASFTIERSYAASPARVFAAFADPKQKRRWFAEGEGWEVEQFDADFRVGGHERSRFRFQGGPPITNDTVYQVIQPNERIILAYAMAIDGAPLSGSLLTMEFMPEGTGTRFVFTEQAPISTARTARSSARRARVSCSKAWPGCSASRPARRREASSVVHPPFTGSSSPAG